MENNNQTRQFDYRKKNIKGFVLSLIGLMVGAFLLYYDQKMQTYNSTVLAFSYKYGFLSRGLIGSIYQLIDKIIPIDLMNHDAAIIVTLIVTILLAVGLVFFFVKILEMIPEDKLIYVEYVIILFAINCVSMFFSKRNFGRLDIYMLAVSIFAAYIIIKGKYIFAVIPLAGVGVMIHQGYVFMFLNIILVLLFVRMLEYNTGKEDTEKKYIRINKKYLFIFVLTIIVTAALCLYFELFSHFNGEEILDEIVRDAKALGLKGDYHKTLIDHEILGIDLTKSEIPYHIENLVEIPIIVVFAMPFIILGVKFVKKIWNKAKIKQEKLKYLAVICGPLTMLPCYLLKVDFGRWDFAVIAYMNVVVIALVAMGDEIVSSSLIEIIDEVKSKYSFWYILLIYALLFFPFWDVHVDTLTMRISNVINENFLGEIW